MSQESSRRASARREKSFQPKDLGWLDPCDRHRDEGGERSTNAANVVIGALSYETWCLVKWRSSPLTQPASAPAGRSS
ncbi:hypothetical protein DXM26_13705 [Agrobacterium tumefaciens]|nr:hypothetical protein DXM26_13705 [Agrobacterium tumefaciens]